MAPAGAARYVYGVVPAHVAGNLDGTGIGDKPLDVVELDELGALTSEVPGEFLEAGREELLAHAGALERAFEHGVVLPMTFGIVMDSEEAVRTELLSPHREELAAQLAELDGKVEIKIKGIYQEAPILREILAENREVAQLKETIAHEPEDATYPERIRLGELVAESLEAKREADSEAISSRLAGHALEVDQAEAMHERMAVNCSFLVDRSNLEAFDAALEEIAAAEEERIRFSYTGPLPPHSFVELSLES
jgi:hypothetical protein